MADTTVTPPHTRSVNATPPAQRTATVTLPVDVLRVVYALQLARNQGQDAVLVRVKDWRVDLPPG